MSNVEKYLSKNSLDVKDIFPGVRYFGEKIVDDICKQALEKDNLIEFFYASENDMKADKLSYRFIVHTNRQNILSIP